MQLRRYIQSPPYFPIYILIGSALLLWEHHSCTAEHDDDEDDDDGDDDDDDGPSIVLRFCNSMAIFKSKMAIFRPNMAILGLLDICETGRY